ncbi:MAG: hypothetical protein II036_06205 [Oscillospiraceae bacterium]|nr:hypothetical protein [Oscillospiraceae bacterium]MBQ2602349.1 hypothetical protein [Oscillospiraceae bacterium]
MTEKEIMYVEDALGHTEFLRTQAQTAISQLTDPQLKAKCQELVKKNEAAFGSFFSLV